jgi:alpha,alpha-trehalose phosphorylase
VKIHDLTEAIDRRRFPIDPWRLVETRPSTRDLGLTETLFAIGNGYIGMRANPPEGRDASAHGTYVNGLHETWPIEHAEDAYGFAKTGQTIVNAPDSKLMKVYVDDEPLLLSTADLDEYERVLDFSTGRYHRDLLWRTPSGKRVRLRTERMVSLEHRHLVVLHMELTLLDASAPVVISSQLLNRQDGQDEYHVRAAALGNEGDPRKARLFRRRVLIPQLHELSDQEYPGGGTATLGYRCDRSGMTLACAYRHEIDTACEFSVRNEVTDDIAKSEFTIAAQPGEAIRITKFVSYHSSRGVPVRELADRCHRTLDRARHTGRVALHAEQVAWLAAFWERSDVTIGGHDAAQQAIRWNLFQLAQATARNDHIGVPAKGVTAGGYDGHYFWDTEVYIVPFLAYTNPDAARKLLRFRYFMLDAARLRAIELSQRGALYPWRTINGEEASAYYAAGTAQYHINAAVVYALERYINATGDMQFLVDKGAEILVETARLFEDLGFYDGEEAFHIHGVTGPDEYTAVVNDNLYTNVMARFAMRYAAQVIEFLRTEAPDALQRVVAATGLQDHEVPSWNRACDAMYLPYDETLGIHPQDASFLDLERWDFANTPDDKYPLLLHFHPLVIYRHQVLKQADVVLAMFLRGEHFDVDIKRRNFEYYDPITTGDSSLSACVQSIMASVIGKPDLAWKYFEQSLFLDLADTHGNSSEGVHVANAGGVWAALVHGFAGLVDSGVDIAFHPRLPPRWESMEFSLLRHGGVVRVTVTQSGARVEVSGADPIPVRSETGVKLVQPGTSIFIAACQAA